MVRWNKFCFQRECLSAMSKTLPESVTKSLSTFTIVTNASESDRIGSRLERGSDIEPIVNIINMLRKLDMAVSFIQMGKTWSRFEAARASAEENNVFGKHCRDAENGNATAENRSKYLGSGVREEKYCEWECARCVLYFEQGGKYCSGYTHQNGGSAVLRLQCGLQIFVGESSATLGEDLNERVDYGLADPLCGVQCN